MLHVRLSSLTIHLARLSLSCTPEASSSLLLGLVGISEIMYRTKEGAVYYSRLFSTTYCTAVVVYLACKFVCVSGGISSSVVGVVGVRPQRDKKISRCHKKKNNRKMKTRGTPYYGHVFMVTSCMFRIRGNSSGTEKTQQCARAHTHTSERQPSFQLSAPAASNQQVCEVNASGVLLCDPPQPTSGCHWIWNLEQRRQGQKEQKKQKQNAQHVPKKSATDAGHHLK